MTENNKYKRLSCVDAVRVIQVIQVISIRGEGVEGDPVESITEFFDLNGNRLARISTKDKESANITVQKIENDGYHHICGKCGVAFETNHYFDSKNGARCNKCFDELVRMTH